MRFRVEKKGFTFYIGMHRTRMVDGVNSRLPGGRHFLMWDFDETPLEQLKDELTIIQGKYKLPRIWLINSGLPDHYHANCFKALDWVTCRSIIADTPSVDKKFLAIGILRGFFTLRYSPVEGREWQPATILVSGTPEDVDPFELTSFATYPKRRM